MMEKIESGEDNVDFVLVFKLTKWDVKDVVSVADGGGMANGDCPFLVKVSIPDLNIRKGLRVGLFMAWLRAVGSLYFFVENCEKI